MYVGAGQTVNATKIRRAPDSVKVKVSDSVQKAPPAATGRFIVVVDAAAVPLALPENGSRGEGGRGGGIPFCVDLCHPPIGSHSRSLSLSPPLLPILPLSRH